MKYVAVVLGVVLGVITIGKGMGNLSDGYMISATICFICGGSMILLGLWSAVPSE